jgi:hypothetical protein
LSDFYATIANWSEADRYGCHNRHRRPVIQHDGGRNCPESTRLFIPEGVMLLLCVTGILLDAARRKTAI